MLSVCWQTDATKRKKKIVDEAAGIYLYIYSSIIIKKRVVLSGKKIPASAIGPDV